MNGGLPIYSQYKSMKDNGETFCIKSELTYRDLHRAVLGFFQNLEFDEQLAFACPRHGTKPNWIVADGKNLGPTKKRCKHMSELDRHLEDEQNYLSPHHSKIGYSYQLKKKEQLSVHFFVNK